MHDTKGPTETQPGFRAGIDDAVIVPVAALGLVAKTLLRWTWSLIVHLLDHVVFPIVLQVARFVLFTFRILGDAISGLLRFVIKFLPLPQMKRQAWREAVAQVWSWMRRRLSYAAFEAFLHHIFEDGMAWVFRKCRNLSPGGAVLVILAAIVWMPSSFLLGTAAHTWLIANATTLPAWMQMLHVVAAVLPKSKLLTLPVFPAAWPQAKKHGLVQAAGRVWRFVVGLHLVQKARFRFGRLEEGMDRAAHAFGSALGLIRLWQAVRKLVLVAGTRFGAFVRRIARRMETLPVLGPVFRTYGEHYDRLDEPRLLLSQKIKAFFQRWEIKFTPAYYEAKDAAKRDAKAHGAPPAA